MTPTCFEGCCHNICEPAFDLGSSLYISNFIFIWIVDTTAPSQFKEGRPNIRLYDDGVLTPTYLTITMMVLAKDLSTKYSLVPRILGFPHVLQKIRPRLHRSIAVALLVSEEIQKYPKTWHLSNFPSRPGRDELSFPSLQMKRKSILPHVEPHSPSLLPRKWCQVLVVLALLTRKALP